MQSFDVPGSIESVHEINGIVAVYYWSSACDADFHAIYVDGEPIGSISGPLDAAIAYGIAVRYDGPETLADEYFMRMIGAVEDE